MACIYPKMKCKQFILKSKRKQTQKHVIVRHFLREIDCINELSKANLTRKYSLTNAILQFSLSQTILSHTKDTKT